MVLERAWGPREQAENRGRTLEGWAPMAAPQYRGSGLFGPGAGLGAKEACSSPA